LPGLGCLAVTAAAGAVATFVSVSDSGYVLLFLSLCLSPLLLPTLSMLLLPLLLLLGGSHCLQGSWPSGFVKVMHRVRL
jgi:hypothetical protein